jgi:hypothetical protein
MNFYQLLEYLQRFPEHLNASFLKPYTSMFQERYDESEFPLEKQFLFETYEKVLSLIDRNAA